MPNYFRMSTYSSFQRQVSNSKRASEKSFNICCLFIPHPRHVQLNLYDFQRIAEGPEKGAYWHELFLRDQPMLSTNMKRNKVRNQNPF